MRNTVCGFAECSTQFAEVADFHHMKKMHSIRHLAEVKYMRIPLCNVLCHKHKMCYPQKIVLQSKWNV